MKISINWMLDHIATPISKLDIGLLVAKFNIHTAEIESYEKFNLDLPNLFLVRLMSCDQTSWMVQCEELGNSFQLSLRNDLQIGQYALVRRKNDTFAWQTLQEYHSSKDGLFPAVDCPAHLVAGGWKQACEDTDFIIDVDNKSINHRPDLWGHRGIAGEVAAFMGWQLKPVESMLAKIEEITALDAMTAGNQHALNLRIENPQSCARIAALYCANIVHKPSQIWMAMRLARVDSKPINSIVDLTNYVMFDLSQPMHVFDAATFADGTLVARMAQPTEKLELLDGHAVDLTAQDVVIADGHKPVALAGIMGGKQASFHPAAAAMIIEAGSFHASTIRTSAARLKVMTEACMRFSKQLDPMQNSTALQRFVFLAQGIGVVGTIDEKIISVGKTIQPAVITVSHQMIEDRLGIVLQSAEIVALLEKLYFAVQVQKQQFATMYHVTIPTARMTKDITIAEDVIEEIARLYGYANITYKRPVRAMKSFSLDAVHKMRAIKSYCAFALKMKEVRDYLFYDESFLKRLDWYPINAVAVKNPVSENWKVLVTSLIPHLIKNVELNHASHEQINFFECNNVWHAISEHESVEKKSLAGIFFGNKHANFYDYKAQMQDFFAACNLVVTWAKPATPVEPWFDRLQTADILLNGVTIGRAGMLETSLTRSVVKGSGFIFECDVQVMIAHQPQALQFAPWSKYQAVFVDISMLVDATTSAESLEQAIGQVDPKIGQIALVDFFEKAEWAGKRSLTFRYKISDFEQNLTKEVIDSITEKVIQTMSARGAQVR